MDLTKFLLDLTSREVEIKERISQEDDKMKTVNYNHREIENRMNLFQNLTDKFFCSNLLMNMFDTNYNNSSYDF